MHIDSFFEFCLGKQHSYFTRVPNPAVARSSVRDGVPAEEDLALRAIVPELRHRRVRSQVTAQSAPSPSENNPSIASPSSLSMAASTSLSRSLKSYGSARHDQQQPTFDEANQYQVWHPFSSFYAIRPVVDSQANITPPPPPSALSKQENQENQRNQHNQQNQRNQQSQRNQPEQKLQRSKQTNGKNMKSKPRNTTPNADGDLSSSSQGDELQSLSPEDQQQLQYQQRKQQQSQSPPEQKPKRSRSRRKKRNRKKKQRANTSSGSGSGSPPNGETTIATPASAEEVTASSSATPADRSESASTRRTSPKDSESPQKFDTDTNTSVTVGGDTERWDSLLRQQMIDQRLAYLDEWPGLHFSVSSDAPQGKQKVDATLATAAAGVVSASRDEDSPFDLNFYTEGGDDIFAQDGDDESDARASMDSIELVAELTTSILQSSMPPSLAQQQQQTDQTTAAGNENPASQVSESGKRRKRHGPAVSSAWISPDPVGRGRPASKSSNDSVAVQSRQQIQQAADEVEAYLCATIQRKFSSVMAPAYAEKVATQLVRNVRASLARSSSSFSVDVPNAASFAWVFGGVDGHVENVEYTVTRLQDSPNANPPLIAYCIEWESAIGGIHARFSKRAIIENVGSERSSRDERSPMDL